MPDVAAQLEAEREHSARLLAEVVQLRAGRDQLASYVERRWRDSGWRGQATVGRLAHELNQAFGIPLHSHNPRVACTEECPAHVPF